MNRIIYYLAICLMAVSCNSDVDDKEYISPVDAETEAYLNDGIVVDSEPTTVILHLWHWPDVLTADCSEYWADVDIQQGSESKSESDIEVTLGRNDRWESRVATLTLTAGGVTWEVRIIQRAEQRMETEACVYYMDNTGGDFGVKLKCNVSSEIDVKVNCSEGSEWISFQGINVDHVNPGKPECALHFRATANDGPGRICGVTVSSANPHLNANFCIIQQPHLFGEEETISIDKAGSLDVLLGTDIDNIRQIRRLTLTGQMNSIDWEALRRLFYEGIPAEPKPEDYPVSLDMRQIVSVAGSRSAYYKLGYQPTEPENQVYQDNEIPAHALELCSNLIDIILPDHVMKIGSMAIAKNRNISAVQIPDNVEVIEYGAFQNCRKLSEINISDKSKLRQLGRYAFAGCGPIERLNLPASLSEIESGYLNFAVKELTVHWPTPPELRVPPTVKDGGKLYVPRGSLDKYKEAFGWNRFPNIIELSE